MQYSEFVNLLAHILLLLFNDLLKLIDKTPQHQITWIYHYKYTKKNCSWEYTEGFQWFYKQAKKCIKEINRFRKEINRFPSKGMFNIYLKVTIKKKWRTRNFDFKSL